jgi:hypothetical protein
MIGTAILAVAPLDVSVTVQMAEYASEPGALGPPQVRPVNVVVAELGELAVQEPDGSIDAAALNATDHA